MYRSKLMFGYTLDCFSNTLKSTITNSDIRFNYLLNIISEIDREIYILSPKKEIECCQHYRS